MTWQRTLSWAILVTLAAGGILAVFLFSVPPVDQFGTPDLPVIGAFTALAILVVGGIATIIALLLHRRWPAIAGMKRAPVDPAVAIRQGMLVAATVGVLLILSLLDMLDIAFFLVTVIVAGLIEAFLQSRA